MDKSNNTPVIGMLCWEAMGNPRGLVMTASLCGSSTNPETYTFPIRYFRVKGATLQTVLENPDPKILNAMICGIKQMAAEGVKAVTTSCGFNAIFQQELANAVDIPVFTSSLLQVPYVQSILGKNKTIGIITAKKESLTDVHLRAVGITEKTPVRIFGLEDCQEWSKIFNSPDNDVDLRLIKEDVVGVAMEAKRRHSDIGAYVLECTDLPPFAEIIREKTDCPVFDIVTMTRHVHMAVV